MMDEGQKRQLRIWAAVFALFAAFAFALPYLLPASASRFERGLASAALVIATVTAGLLIEWLDRRRPRI